MNALITLLPMLVPGVDKVPNPNDVKAGWVAFVIFILLGLAVAFLGYSLSKHLRKVRDNVDKGVFDSGDEPRTHAS
jgi:NADH:ubiquinone oxidoreductase subunit 3 (subunit A)